MVFVCSCTGFDRPVHVGNRTIERECIGNMAHCDKTTVGTKSTAVSFNCTPIGLPVPGHDLVIGTTISERDFKPESINYPTITTGGPEATNETTCTADHFERNEVRSDSVVCHK